MKMIGLYNLNSFVNKNKIIDIEALHKFFISNKNKRCAMQRKICM